METARQKYTFTYTTYPCTYRYMQTAYFSYEPVVNELAFISREASFKFAFNSGYHEFRILAWILDCWQLEVKDKQYAKALKKDLKLARMGKRKGYRRTLEEKQQEVRDKQHAKAFKKDLKLLAWILDCC